MKTVLAIDTLLLVALISPAAAQVPRAPLAVVVGKADVIVIAEVTDVGEPKEMDLKAPDFGGKTWCRTFKVKVTRTLGAGGAASKPAETAMEVLARCLPRLRRPAPGLRCTSATAPTTPSSRRAIRT